MNLVPHWWTVLKHAWSIRLIVLASLLMFLEPVLSTAAQYVTYPSIYIQLAVSSLIGLIGLGAAWARIVFQSELRQKNAVKEASNANDAT